jgi:branched-chain amino acid transport system substrate-binding protein
VRITHIRTGAALATIGLLLAACSEKSSTSTASVTTAPTAATAATATTATTATTPATTAVAAATTAASTTATTQAAATTVAPPTTAAGPDLNAWALKYTGGKAGAAAGDPIKIGYANDEGFFPENTVGINAAVAYVNAELGGAAGGRPLQIVPCSVTDAGSGSKCGAQFSNDPTITLVVTGTILQGNEEMYKTLDKKKPVIIGNGLTTADFTTTAGQTFFAGSPAVVPGMAQFVLTGLPTPPKNVIIVANSNIGSKTAAQFLFEPVLKKAGIKVTEAFVDDSAPPSAMQSQLTAAGVDKADAIVSLNNIQQCINLDLALKALNVKTVVVATGLCFGTPMTTHLGGAGDVPDGWYFGDYGPSYFIPDYDSGMLTYLAKIKQYGKTAGGAPLEYTGFAGPSFGNILTATKFFNALGADKLDFASVDAQIRGFKGPMFIQVGPLDCGHLKFVGIAFPATCASQMGIHLYSGGKWSSINDGLKGNPIDASKVAA